MVRFDLPPPPPGVLERGDEAAVEAFLAALAAAGASPKTVKAYAAALRDFIAFIHERGKTLKTVDDSDVAAWVYERLLHGLRRPRGGDRRGRQATLHYYTLFLRGFTEWLGLPVKVPVVRKPRPRSPDALKPEEVERLLNAARDTLDLLIVALLFETGLRAQEAVSLTLRDIDMERRVIRVRNAKYGEERIVLYGPLTDQALRLHLAANPPRSPDQPLLGISYSGLYKRLKSLAKRAGLPPEKVRPHVLRHTFATEALRRGVPLPVVQRLLGHRDIKVTQVYLHLVDEDIRRAYQAAFGAPPPTGQQWQQPWTPPPAWQPPQPWQQQQWSPPPPSQQPQATGQPWTPQPWPTGAWQPPPQLWQPWTQQPPAATPASPAWAGTALAASPAAAAPASEPQPEQDPGSPPPAPRRRR
ncbi:MAG: tyrosine-type recombinase/integrase [Crenarchaeota archaeon]|nr:tyrosine-type recombinase/integrase [Thermoproteota archaeon]